MKRRRRGWRPGSTFVPIVLDDADLLAHAPFVRRALERLGLPPDEVDDLAQEVMLGAWSATRAGRFTAAPEEPLCDPIRGWLTVIVLNRLSHHRRRVRTRNRLKDTLSDCCPDWAPDPTARLEARDTLHALNTLSARDREILALAAMRLPYNEIGAQLGLDRNSVPTRLGRTRKRARRALARWRKSR